MVTMDIDSATPDQGGPATASQSSKEANRCPIDFDHESRQHAQNWPQEFHEMRSKCPMSWTENHGGYWVATRYLDIVQMAQDNATFTSGKTFDPETLHVEGGITIPANPFPRGLPVESDKPEWDGFRALINRQFAPKAAESRRENARKYATALINRFIETGRADIVNDFTSPLPALITMELLGFPLHEWRQFADPLHEMAFTGKADPDFPRVIQNLDWMHARVREEIVARRRDPNEALISHMIREEVNGGYLTDDEIHSFCINILTGGVDTTTGLTSNVLIYLWQNPAEKKRLMENPDLVPRAREEFIRFFSPIHALSRNLSRDAVVNGAEMLKGEHVLLAFAAANRDPEIFEQPDTVIMDRFPNRHIGFGAGMHRCAGSFLARVMIETMLDTWLTRIPDYQIDLDEAESYKSIATVNGWKTIPATFKPGPKIDVGFEL
jgi:cytochrome P450